MKYLRKQKFFIEFYKENAINYFINFSNEGLNFFYQMNAYCFNNEKIFKLISTKIDLDWILYISKIDLFIHSDLSECYLFIYFRLPTNKIQNIKLAEDLEIVEYDEKRHCTLNVDEYFDFNNWEKDRQIACIKHYEKEFNKDVQENKKDSTNKIYSIRFWIIFLFHSLKVKDLKRNIFINNFFQKGDLLILMQNVQSQKNKNVI